MTPNQRDCGIRGGSREAAIDGEVLAATGLPSDLGCFRVAQNRNLRDYEQVLQRFAILLDRFGKPALRAGVSSEADRSIERRANRSRLAHRLEQLERLVTNPEQRHPLRHQCRVMP